MIKGGFEIVHGSLDMMIQPNESWELSSIGFQTTTTTTTTTSLPKPVNDLSDWVEQVTKQLIDDLPDSNTILPHHTTIVTYDHEKSVHNHHNFKPKKPIKRNHNTFNIDTQYQYQHQTRWMTHDLDLDHDHSVDGHNQRAHDHDNEKGLTQITLLMECAVAISVDNLDEAHKMLLELTEMVSPYGPSCAERVVAYFAKAMSSRVINSWLGICSPLINHKTIHSSFQLFNNISPFIKFAHFTSNQTILEAFQQRDHVHIIDLDIMQGLQWPALFHILATRIEGPPHVRMTGMGSSIDVLIETGKNLSIFAKRLGLSFEYNPVSKKVGEVNDFSTFLRRTKSETLAVHWLQHSLYDATGSDHKTMRFLEEVSPDVITLVEQDVSCGPGGSFLDRFVGSLHYYSTLFDSIGGYMRFDDADRHRVEHCVLYREINNVLAIGGPRRSGEEKFREWRSEFGMRNWFVKIGMSNNSMGQAQLILNMFPPVHGYRLVEDDGTLKLGWKDTSLFTASAWTSHASSSSR